MTKCNVCNKEFEAKNPRYKLCSDECRKMDIKSKQYIGRDTIVCKWCNMEVVRVYGIHMKLHHPGKTTTDYKNDFPGSPITSSTDAERVSKNSGKHMKTEKYKEMFSKKILGENNPNHKSKTTEQERKERSPFSKEFYKKKGIEEENIDDVLHEFAKNAVKDRLTESNLQYWINKCETIDEANQKYIERQTTFTFEKCVEKYGEEEGFKVWYNRQQKWINSYKKLNYSKISQSLFIILYEHEKLKDLRHNVFFAVLDKENNCYDFSGKNYEYRLNLNKSNILPDFYLENYKKIIEFDGVYWHKNNPENSARELRRDTNIFDSGYKVLHINENDYKKNTNEVINKCIDFLLND